MTWTEWGSAPTWDWDLRGLWEPSGGILGEQGGVPEEESDPRPSVNQEKGTKDPEERDGLSEGSLRTEDHVRTGNTPNTRLGSHPEES